ncbi:phosphatidylserine decarboxylase [Labilibacter marinus]|uniref:phosphatidylserine decarboxylase n=1 Tax=Labilibacter marinus TaxID=1477105 RepID=UPI00094F9976|nr:phosphatidylserine decarboxylase [Labilibacter marinus]
MESINYIERSTNTQKKEEIVGKGALNWLYYTPGGKITLHMLLKRKFASTVVGHFMSSPLSTHQVRKFIRKYKIDLSQYHNENGYRCFNDFFYRKLKDGQRLIGDALVSPADGKVLAFQDIDHVPSFFIKGSEFKLHEFLNDEHLAKKYEGGSMVIIRLAPTDYHRFHFPVNGIASEARSLKGRYFSVSPVAMKKSIKILVQNRRVFSTIQSDNYGDVIMAEIGAALVGSIKQTYEPNSKIEKGTEKGYFAYGGSTVVLFFEKGKVSIDKDLLENTRNHLETEVKMGENIGR